MYEGLIEELEVELPNEMTLYELLREKKNHGADFVQSKRLNVNYEQ
jgi:hypothetical protein